MIAARFANVLLNHSLNVSGLRKLDSDSDKHKHKCAYQGLHYGLFFPAFPEVLEKKKNNAIVILFV